MENLVVRKRHAGFGPAVEGEALVGNYRQAPPPTGMFLELSEARQKLSKYTTRLGNSLVNILILKYLRIKVASITLRKDLDT
jgi:hypothetical protein